MLNSREYFGIIGLLLALHLMVSGCGDEMSRTEPNDTTELLLKIKEKYKDCWFKHYAFKQKTIFYDSLETPVDSALWFEAISYPKNFRIDFDSLRSSYAIFRNDSIYRFEQYSLVYSGWSPQEFLLLKGGLHFLPVDSVLYDLTQWEYDLSNFKKTNYNSKPAYSIGNSNKNVVFDSTTLFPLKRSYLSRKGSLIEVIYGNFKKIKCGCTEQEVTFLRNSKVIQKEYYQNITVLDSLNVSTFEPGKNYNWHSDTDW